MSDIKKTDRKVLILRMDPKLVEEIDRRATERKMTRNDWFIAMATWAVKQK